MILPVYVYGHPLLRKVSGDIGSDYQGQEKLIGDMYETMYASAGVGLAAPQIGLNIRLFIIDAAPYAREIGDKYPLKRVFINPRILDKEGEPWIFEEGCLSVPEIREDVERPSEVTIRCQNEHFEFFTEKFDGMMARIIQHEYDHLEGILFIDHISNIRKIMLKRRLSDISRGKIIQSYKMKFPNVKR